MARKLYDVNEISFLLERSLQDLGLYDEPDFLTELEILFNKEQQIEQQKRAAKR